jgi:uncharacterized protein YoxC
MEEAIIAFNLVPLIIDHESASGLLRQGHDLQGCLHGRLASPLPLMKRGKPSMTPQEIQRTMDFILRSQADSIVRMDLWEEKQERWQEQIQNKIDQLDEKLEKAIEAVHEAAKLNKDATRASRMAASTTQKHAKQIKTLHQSTRLVKRRPRSMADLMKLAMHLLAHQSKRLDALENNR